MILAIETSTKAFSVSMFHGKESAHLEFLHNIAQSQKIVSAVDFLLKGLKASVRDLEAVYAGTGPGSFTGIRVGLTFANALHQLLGVPLAGIASLDLLALGNGSRNNSVISFIKSRKNEVYAAYYREGRRASEYAALEKQAFLSFIREHDPGLLVSSEDDLKEIGLEIAALKRCRTVFDYPRARNCLMLAKSIGLQPQRGFLKPLYVRRYNGIPYIY